MSAVYLSTHVHVYLCTYLPVYISTHVHIYLCTYLPVYISTFMCVCLCTSVYLSGAVYLSNPALCTNLSVYTYISVHANLSTDPSPHLSTRQHAHFFEQKSKNKTDKPRRIIFLSRFLSEPVFINIVSSSDYAANCSFL